MQTSLLMDYDVKEAEIPTYEFLFLSNSGFQMLQIRFRLKNTLYNHFITLP